MCNGKINTNSHNKMPKEDSVSLSVGDFDWLVKIVTPKYFYKNVNASLKKKISYYIVDVENSDEENSDKKILIKKILVKKILMKKSLEKFRLKNNSDEEGSSKENKIF